MVELYLAISVLCGIVTAFLAAEKGRSVFGWLLIGFFFGILGLVLVMVLPHQPHQPRVSSPSRDFMKDDLPPFKLPPLESSSQSVGPTDTSSARKNVIPPTHLLRYEQQKWDLLKEVDTDIAASAKRVAALGTNAEAEFAYSFLLLDNKLFLDALEARVTQKLNAIDKI